MTAPSVVDVVGADRIMEDLLQDRVIGKGGLTNCVNPAHDDEHPSMSVNIAYGVFKCHACGVGGGALDLAVLRGVGRDVKEAAAALAEKYHVGNGHAGNGAAAPAAVQARPERAFPYYPKTAESLGWGFEDGDLVVPTWLPGGKKGRTKRRGPRGENGRLRIAFESDADDCGLINLPALEEHSAGVEQPRCALLAGETDLLAWTWACKAEGIDVPGVSPSTGEGSTISGEMLAPFRGVVVYVFFDRDDAGAKGGRDNAEALAKGGAKSAKYVPVPAPHKDVRDYVEAGGKIRDLLALAEKVEEKPFQPIRASDLLAKVLPPIEELVAPRIIYRGGTTALVASHKRGKSLAALSLCVDLVVNLAVPLEKRIGDAAPKWLGQEIVGAGPALVYSAEGGERMVQERLRKLASTDAQREALERLFVYAKTPAPQLDKEEELDAVFAHAEAVGAVLLVFDPLGRFWSMEDEADPTAARNLMLAVQTRAERAYGGKGIAVLLVHHDTKATGADADSAVTGGRGSGKFGDDADALINLKIGGKGAPAGQSKAMFLLRHAESPSPVVVQIDPRTLRIRPATDDEKPKKPERRNGPAPRLSLENLEKCVRHFKRIPCKRLPGELGISYGSWKNARRGLIDDLLDGGEFIHDTETDELVLLVDGNPWSPPPEQRLGTPRIQ